MLSRRLSSEIIPPPLTCQSGSSPSRYIHNPDLIARSTPQGILKTQKHQDTDTRRMLATAGDHRLKAPKTTANHSFRCPQPSSKSPTTPRNAHKLHHSSSSRTIHTNPKQKKDTKKSLKTHTKKSTHSHLLSPSSKFTHPASRNSRNTTLPRRAFYSKRVQSLSEPPPTLKHSTRFNIPRVHNSLAFYAPNST